MPPGARYCVAAEEFFYTHSVDKTKDKAAWIAGIKNGVPDPYRTSYYET